MYRNTNSYIYKNCASVHCAFADDAPFTDTLSLLSAHSCDRTTKTVFLGVIWLLQTVWL